MLKSFHVSPVLELPDDIESHDVETQVYDSQEVSKEILDEWFAKTVSIYKSDRVVSKTHLSEKEFNFVKSNSVTTGVDVCYMLLAKYLDLNFEAQLQCVLMVIRFLEDCRLPKDYMGGFMILIIKYHFLPA